MRGHWIGFALLGVLRCSSETTNNYAACGPGTRHDPELNACVPIEDDAGGGGGAAGASGSGGTAGSPVGGAGGGAAGGTPDAGDASVEEAGPEPDPNDDKCLTDVEYLVNGDKACGTYNPVGVCSGEVTETVELERLGYEDLRLDPDDPSKGGVWVRTPSHPGANAACGDGCSRPGTVARVRIPIRNDMAAAILNVYVVHDDEEQTIEPWHVSYARLSEGCVNPPTQECVFFGLQAGEEANILIETSDPEAPARAFRIYKHTAYNNGACDVSQSE